MEWADDVTNRPRRANAGNRLQELLQNGLDEDDERDLQGLDDNSSSDTSFTLGSDEETIDEVDSDFDADEVAGVLEGELIETEATVRRAERQERQRERQRRLQRSQNFAKAAAHDRAMQRRRQQQQQQQNKKRRKRKRTRASRDGSSSEGDSDDGEEAAEGDGVDLRQRVRRRPPPRLPCPQRLAEAHARAAARRAAQAAAAEEDGAEAGSSGVAAMLHTHKGMNMGKAKPRSRRSTAALRAGVAVVGTDGSAASPYAQPLPVFVSPRIALYSSGSQSVRLSSGVSVLQQYKVPTVLTFSESLPPVFQR